MRSRLRPAFALAIVMLFAPCAGAQPATSPPRPIATAAPYPPNAHGRIESLAAFDRTHVLNLAAAYDLGRRWRAGARATLLSGVPTQIATNDGPRFVGSTRASPYLRLDLRLEKRWLVGKEGWWSVVAEALNATMSHEVIGRSYGALGCDESRVGPIFLPSLGVEAGF